MYLFIFATNDLRDDLEVLKSKLHDISGKKSCTNISEKIGIRFYGNQIKFEI